LVQETSEYPESQVSSFDDRAGPLGRALCEGAAMMQEVARTVEEYFKFSGLFESIEGKIDEKKKGETLSEK
jgi:hypothetical protein